MLNLQLLTLAEVAKLLGRRPETVRKDIIRNPGAVPPRVIIPGTRLLRWRREDVERWLTCCSVSTGVEQ
jgi:predicted DNA-binding transcriptional regulator AlpA